MKKKLVVLALVGMAGVAATVLTTTDADAAAKPKVTVCHFDNDGLLSAPKTLSVGDQKAANKHVANHTEAKGHEGNDYFGACTP